MAGKKNKRKHHHPAKKRKHNWPLLTLLGLAIGLLSLIELRPQLSIEPREPTEKSQPFSVPFRIENSGYFSFWLEHAICYYHHIEAGKLTVDRDASQTVLWNGMVLNRNEGETISCNIARIQAMPASADIAIIVDYRPWGWFPWTFRTYRRFTGAYIDTWQWNKQPSDPIKADADVAVDNLVRTLSRFSRSE